MKNWLIRTKTNFLLGPISREKLMELIKSGSIQDDDELCSGNGYWFYLREKHLVQRYLVEEQIQEFNPVSEAINERKLRQAKQVDALGPVDEITVIMKSGGKH